MQTGKSPRARQLFSIFLLIACVFVPWITQAGNDKMRLTEEAPTTPPMATGDNVITTFRVTTGNNIGLTVYNDGFVGTNLANRNPSMEYPLGSNQEHLTRAGVWIGGVTIAGDTLVSTSAIAAFAGDRGFPSEYVAASNFEELSFLPNNRYFSFDAISEQDFIYSFVDSVPAPGGVDPHVPLNIKVRVRTLLYSFEPFDAFVIMNMDIINNSQDPIFGLAAGIYTELATGWKDPSDENWRSGWFGNKNIAWVDSLGLLTEHHFNGDNGDAPSWGGAQLLGTRSGPLDSIRTSFNWWDWGDEVNRNPGAPIFDNERYRTMTNGLKMATDGSEAPTFDPVCVHSIGPFGGSEGVFAPGDTITVGWAWLGGDFDLETGRTPEQDIAFNAGWAREAFDTNFNIPLPPPSPDIAIIPENGKLVLRWSDSPEEFEDPQSGNKDFQGYRIYISESRLETEFEKLLEADIVDTVFYNTGIDHLAWDPVTIDTTDYKYRFDVGGVKDGFKYWASITAFDTGTIDIRSLESGLSQNRTFAIPGSPASTDGSRKVTVFPNPYNGDAVWDGSLGRDRYLWFTNLPPRCKIRIYTLAGDHVDTIDFDENTYQPTDIRGIYDPTDPRNPENDLPELSGGMAAWDLVTDKDQGVATGLYMFAVENLDNGDRQIGKFLILK